MEEYRDHYFPNTEELKANEMRVVALGTGRPFARPAQANASWLLELGSGEKLLFDFGYGSFRNFTALEIPISAITAFFATHLHADHVGDFGSHWIAGWLSGRFEPMQAYGPSGPTYELGFKAFAEHQMKSYAWDAITRQGHFPEAGGIVDIHEFNWEKEQIVYEKDDLRVCSFPAVHFYEGAVGFRVEWRGCSFVYSGDTAANNILVRNAIDADLLIHEVFNTTEQLRRRSGHSPATAKGIGSVGHTQPTEAGKVFSACKPKMAVAYHFFNDFDTRSEVDAGIRKYYDGPLSLAEDFMVFNVTPEMVKVRMAATGTHVWPNKKRHNEFRAARHQSVAKLPDWLEAERIQVD